MKKISYLFLGLLLIAITGCKKGTITMYGSPAGGVSIKFIHVAPGTPAVDGYINGTKITPQANISVTDNAAVTSIVTGISYNYTGTSATTYLGLFPGLNYAAVPSGSTVIKVQASTPIPALVSPQTAAPGAVIGSATQATTNGSAYTVFVSGLPGSSTAPLGINVVPDNFTQTDATKAYVRFADMVPNGNAVDLGYSVTLSGATAATTGNLVTGAIYSKVSDFVAVTVNPIQQTNYVFQMYQTGTTTKFGSASATIALAPGRYYTIIGRGLAVDYPVPGTNITIKASARPTLPLTDPNTKLPEIYFAPAQLAYYTNK